MRRVVIVLAAFAVVLPAACKKGQMAGRMKAAAEEKRAAIQVEVDKVLSGWLDSMAKSLPADVKKYPKVRSPLVRWRLDSFQYDWRRPYAAAIASAKGTAAEAEFVAIQDFFDTMEKFWDKKVDFKDYMEAYDKLKASTKDKIALQLADFDHVFVHIEGFYGASDIEGDDRAVYNFRHWQVAFHFPREYGEAVSEYLARLCRQKLSDYCSKLPFETIHFSVEKPYLDEVLKIVGKFQADYPDSPLARVVPPFLDEVRARLAKIPEYKEDPVVPGSVSKAPYVGHVKFKVTKEGIGLEDKTYLDFSSGWILPAPKWAGFTKDMDKALTEMERVNGPENMEFVLVTADRGMAVDVLAGIVDAVKKLAPRTLTFGARRRADGVSRLTVTGHLQFREVKLEGRKVEVDGVGKATCRPLGQSDDKADLPQKVGPAVWLGKDGPMTGTFADGKLGGLAKAEPAAAAKHLASGVGLLLVAADVPYEAFLGVIDPLFYACSDPKCEAVAAQTPRVEVQVCTVK